MFGLWWSPQNSAHSIKKAENLVTRPFMTTMIITMIRVAEILAHKIEKAEIPVTPPVMAYVFKETIIVELPQISAYSIEILANSVDKAKIPVTPPLMACVLK